MAKTGVVQTRSKLVWRSGASGEIAVVCRGNGELPVRLSSPLCEVLSPINRSPWSSAAVKGLLDPFRVRMLFAAIGRISLAIIPTVPLGKQGSPGLGGRPAGWAARQALWQVLPITSCFVSGRPKGEVQMGPRRAGVADTSPSPSCPKAVTPRVQDCLRAARYMDIFQRGEGEEKINH